MVKATDLIDAQETLRQYWPEDAEKVIEECSKVEPFGGSCGDFLNHCFACGGDWGGMYLTGVKELYPNVWKAIPNEMGIGAWFCICSVLMLVGVDTTA